MSDVAILETRRARVAVSRTAPRVAPPAAPAGTLRLTRRGRVLLLALFAVLLFAAFSVGRVTGNATPGGGPAVHRVVVSSGDTLWSIAQQIAPGSDPRVTVDTLVRLNHLTGGNVRAGQALIVPGG